MDNRTYVDVRITMSLYSDRSILNGRVLNELFGSPQETGVRRMKDVEFVFPVVVGTVAFNLGKKVRVHA